MAGPALGYGVDRSLSPQEEAKVLCKHNTWTDVRGMTIPSLGRALPSHFTNWSTLADKKTEALGSEGKGPRPRE